MKVMVIPVVVSALVTIPKGLVKGLEDLEIRGQMETYWHSNSNEKLSTNVGVKNSQRSKYNNNNNNNNMFAQICIQEFQPNTNYFQTDLFDL